LISWGYYKEESPYKPDTVQETPLK
jgi:hypothetical protein